MTSILNNVQFNEVWKSVKPSKQNIMILAYAFNQVDILPACDYPKNPHSCTLCSNLRSVSYDSTECERCTNLTSCLFGLEQIHVPPRAHATFDVETIFMEDLKCNGSPVYTLSSSPKFDSIWW